MTATYRASRFRLADDPSVAVVNLGMACCTLEFESAVRTGLLEPEGQAAAAGRTVVLVSGTITEPLAPALTAVLAGLDAVVLSVGACATSGGPYWDAPSVVSGADGQVPVAAYVPGCPPRPEAIVAAIREAANA